MGENGKRPRRQRDNDLDNRNQKRRFSDNEGKSNDEIVIYRILCPDGVIGSVIGKNGKVINAIRQETQAKVKVVDPFPGAKDRVIMIYCYVKEKVEVELDEEFNYEEPLCAAQDAVLRIHSAIATSVASASDSNEKPNNREECRILVPSSQSANIIGKAGSTIKKLRNKTRTLIKVTSKDSSDPTHSCAMDFDNFVLISGEPPAVKKALFSVSAIMYKFSPREQIPLETNVAEAPPIIIPTDVPVYPSSGSYPNSDPILQSRLVPPILSAFPLADIQGYADTGSALPVYSSALPVTTSLGGSFRSEELILKVLCPANNIGRVIGKGGATVKGIRQASGARIDVSDSKADNECLVIVTATESPDDLKSAGVEALLLLQEKINDEDEDRVKMRLLVPSKVIGCIIGKSGSIINEIRRRTKADIHISKGNKPKCGDSSDELVEVSGDVGSVRDALIQIVLRLRDDVLRDKDGGHKPSTGTDNLFPGNTSLPMTSLLPSVPQVAPFGYDRRVENGDGLGMLTSGSLYGYGSLPMGENSYGSMSPYPPKLFGGVSAPSTLELLVPANAVNKVLGKAGSNLSNIRKISGAMVEISDSKSSRGDRIAIISGTPEQKRSAENLIRAFIMAT